MLRVVLNGDETISASVASDFDLYVRQGSPATTAEFDCRPFLFGNYEVCEFASPATGMWHILVNLFGGVGGDYQVTTTMFGTLISESTIFQDDFEDQ